MSALGLNVDSVGSAACPLCLQERPLSGHCWTSQRCQLPLGEREFQRLSSGLISFSFHFSPILNEPVKLVARDGSGEPDGHEAPITIIPASVITNRRAKSMGGSLESKKCVRIAGKA